MPIVKLSVDAVNLLNNYSWPGNVRQLKNMVEQISVIETAREITPAILLKYLPQERDSTPALITDSKESINERELMYKFLFDMKKDLTELKKLVIGLIPKDGAIKLSSDQASTVDRIYSEVDAEVNQTKILPPASNDTSFDYAYSQGDNYEKHGSSCK